MTFNSNSEISSCCMIYFTEFVVEPTLQCIYVIDSIERGQTDTLKMNEKQEIDRINSQRENPWIQFTKHETTLNFYIEIVEMKECLKPTNYRKLIVLPETFFCQAK